MNFTNEIPTGVSPPDVLRDRSRSIDPARIRRILFAVDGVGEPTEALRRAAALAVIYDAELFVLRVLPPRITSGVPYPHLAAADALALPVLHSTATALTRIWCTRTVLQPLPGERILVRYGGLFDQVTASAAELAAELVVLGAEGGFGGAPAIAIARVTGVPVLVARRPAERDSVVVATNLADERYPVIRRGLDFARRIDAHVTFLHNVAPEPELSQGLRRSSPAALDVVLEMLATRTNHLRSLAEDLDGDATSVVISRPAPVTAILEVARRRQSDIVVVGTRMGPLDNLSRSVAVQVAERASRSVLVIPVDRADHASCQS